MVAPKLRDQQQNVDIRSAVDLLREWDLARASRRLSSVKGNRTATGGNGPPLAGLAIETRTQHPNVSRMPVATPSGCPAQDNDDEITSVSRSPDIAEQDRLAILAKIRDNFLDGTIPIFLKTYHGTTVTITAHPTTTIRDFKLLAQDVDGVPPGHQIIVYAGRVFQQWTTLQADAAGGEWQREMMLKDVSALRFPAWAMS